MKNSGKTMISCFIGLLVISIALPVFTFARNDTFIELPERVGASPGIVLEVPFDAALSAGTITRSNVYVTDGQGNRMPVARETGSGSKSIIVTPMKRYEPGKTYTMYIRKAVRYASGEELQNGLKLKFTIAKAAEEILPTVSSKENLKKLLEEAVQQNDYLVYGTKKVRSGILTFDLAEAVPASAAAENTASAKAAADTGSGDYSTTNIQVDGVDEADIVKTDGKYLYQVNNNRIVIAEIYPADKMKIKKIIGLDEQDISPMELYLDEKHLIVIGSSWIDAGKVPAGLSNSKTIMPPRHSYYRDNTVKLLIYDIADKENIKLAREIELEGSYLSSRKIGSKLYLISNKYLNYYDILENSEADDTPSYRDTAVKEEFIDIDYEKIGYFPGSIEPNYMIAAGINLDKPSEGVNVSTYLGSGESIYASAQNLYVAVTRHNITPRDPVIQDSAAPKTINIKVADRETVIYRFALNNGKLDYTGKGQVPGSILNQFSMDEKGSFFRIATTKGDMWREGEYTSKNNIYVLDSELNICGSLEDIAPGERIYSVRFMGDRAYMVTFKKVDPLFVIDLKDPKHPKILGALKIPGYSDYLHPYDENHIIGFGKDTIELSNEGSWGKSGGTTAYYQGMKIALFDVSDVSNPKEKFKEIIGDRGTDSELLNNHKALLFSKDKELMAFPVTVMEIKEADNDKYRNIPAYGSFSFQGAYIYNIDLEEGFKLKAKISHISEEEYQKSGDRWYDSNKNVERIIYVGDDIYTISKGMIKANSIGDMKEKGSLLIP